MASSAQLQRQYNNLSAQKSTLESRVKELKSIQSKIYDSLSDYITKVNTYTGDARNAFRNGLTGATSKTTVDSALSDFSQKGVGTDSYLSSVLNNIANEISRCNRKISSLSSEMSSTKSAINTAKAKEKKAAEEAAAAAAAAASN